MKMVIKKVMGHEQLLAMSHGNLFLVMEFCQFCP